MRLAWNVAGVGVLASLILLFAGGAVAEGSTCEVTYDNFGKEFMARYCNACHDSAKTGFARKGAPEGYDFDTPEGVKEEARKILERVAATGKKRMPPADPQPTDEERARLKAWLECEYKR